MSGPYLVVDTSSPTTTLALGTPGRRGRSAELEQKQTSERLLTTIDRLVRAEGVAIEELGGMVALRGPGSFTGLRIGLATLYGLHEATGVRARAISTLEALAAPLAGRDQPVGSIVDALRGEWFVQTFRDGAATAPHVEPTLVAGADLDALAIGTWTGHRRPESLSRTAEWVAPENLAADVLERDSMKASLWDATTLLRPLYLRPPAVTPPRA